MSSVPCPPVVSMLTCRSSLEVIVVLTSILGHSSNCYSCFKDDEACLWRLIVQDLAAGSGRYLES